ncbi:dolichol-phosphate mannosyltransferase subunit 3, putative [Hepatocystis sp. ex Piliocolobus tephrosceles]|nr:dolichol-phosphate mannosyltransferase subunit 3, putative [Hepatocystis sp. ex Piliocolobus tephrosceles]
MLTRGKVIIITFLVSTIFWIYKFDQYKKSNSLIKWILIPTYLLGALCCYVAVCISIRLYNFNNVPNAYTELLNELDTIKKELEMKNFVFR